MSENKFQNMPHFASLDDLVEFFDTHDLGEYLDGSPEAHFEMDIQQRTHLFALDEELTDKLTEIALSRKEIVRNVGKSQVEEIKMSSEFNFSVYQFGRH